MSESIWISDECGGSGGAPVSHTEFRSGKLARRGEEPLPLWIYPRLGRGENRGTSYFRLTETHREAISI